MAEHKRGGDVCKAVAQTVCVTGNSCSVAWLECVGQQGTLSHLGVLCAQDLFPRVERQLLRMYYICNQNGRSSAVVSNLGRCG